MSAIEMHTLSRDFSAGAHEKTSEAQLKNQKVHKKVHLIPNGESELKKSDLSNSTRAMFSGVVANVSKITRDVKRAEGTHDDIRELPTVVNLFDKLTQKFGLTWKTVENCLVSKQTFTASTTEYTQACLDLYGLIKEYGFELRHLDQSKNIMGKLRIKIDVSVVIVLLTKKYSTKDNIAFLSVLSDITYESWVIRGEFYVCPSVEEQIAEKVFISKIKRKIGDSIEKEGIGELHYIALEKSDGRFVLGIYVREFIILCRLKALKVLNKNINWISKGEVISTKKMWPDPKQPFNSAEAQILKQSFGDNCLKKFKAIEITQKRGEKRTQFSLGFKVEDFDSIFNSQTGGGNDTIDFSKTISTFFS